MLLNIGSNKLIDMLLNILLKMWLNILNMWPTIKLNMLLNMWLNQLSNIQINMWLNILLSMCLTTWLNIPLFILLNIPLNQWSNTWLKFLSSKFICVINDWTLTTISHVTKFSYIYTKFSSFFSHILLFLY